LASLSSRNALRGVMLAGMAAVAFGAVHFLRWPKMQPVVASLTAAGEKMPEFGNASDWDIWLSTRDLEIRSQAERGVEDSVSALILFGTTFTNLPPIASANAAANAAGSLTPAVNARIDAFIKALDERDDERFVTVLDFLRRRRVTEEELRAFLAGIVRRLALERTGEERLHEYTTSALLMVDFAIEEALRALKSKGETPAQTHRIAIISGGLDFAGTPGNYDFHQPQAITPFAVLEAALRLNLAQPGDAQVAVFELSPFALAHLRSAAAKARAGGRYVLQLPRLLEPFRRLDRRGDARDFGAGGVARRRDSGGGSQAATRRAHRRRGHGRRDGNGGQHRGDGVRPGGGFACARDF
jgi:hypothetical protein